MKGIAALIALAVGGGLLIYFMSRRGNSAGLPADVEEWTEEYKEWYESQQPDTTYKGEPLPEYPTEPGIYGLFPDPNDGYMWIEKSQWPTEVVEPEYVPEVEPVKELYTEIPGELIPITGGPGSWYDIRKIEETLGWTEAQYAEQVAQIRTIPGIERTSEQAYAGGYTTEYKMGEAEYYRYILEQEGGSRVAGVLVPPADWGGSVTQYAQHLMDRMKLQGY